MVTGERICIQNIGPRERGRRLGFGVAALLLGIVGAGALSATGADKVWRFALFVPFWLGALGVFQALERT